MGSALVVGAAQRDYRRAPPPTSRSYLGVEFVYEALRKEAGAGAALEGRRLRFLANVDPTDVARALEVRGSW